MPIVQLALGETGLSALDFVGVAPSSRFNFACSITSKARQTRCAREHGGAEAWDAWNDACMSRMRAWARRVCTRCAVWRWVERLRAGGGTSGVRKKGSAS